jgi:hypothetical protein
VKKQPTKALVPSVDGLTVRMSLGVEEWQVLKWCREQGWRASSASRITEDQSNNGGQRFDGWLVNIE